MTARPPAVCDVPSPDHHGPVRPYPCGPRCSTHAPVPHANRTRKEQP